MYKLNIQHQHSNIYIYIIVLRASPSHPITQNRTKPVVPSFRNDEDGGGTLSPHTMPRTPYLSLRGEVSWCVGWLSAFFYYNFSRARGEGGCGGVLQDWVTDC